MLVHRLLIIDTTVQPKNVMFPTDAKLLNRAREVLVRKARQHGVSLRQSYARVGKIALIKQQRYTHAKQFKRARRSLKALRTYLGRVTRDTGRKIKGDAALEEAFAWPLSLATWPTGPATRSTPFSPPRATTSASSSTG